MNSEHDFRKLTIHQPRSVRHSSAFGGRRTVSSADLLSQLRLESNYLVFVNAVLFLLITLISASGAWANLPNESSREQCSSLISGAVPSPSLAFIELVDLGLSELRQEVPTFQSNLLRVVESAFPLNPFIDLQSPLATAASRRVERAIEAKGFEWSWIRSQLRLRLHKHEQNQAAVVRDQHITEEVQGDGVVTFEDLEPDRNPGLVLTSSDFKYVGETKNYHVVAAGAFFGVHHGAELNKPWVAYLISKTDHQIHRLDKYLVGTFFGQVLLWVVEEKLIGVATDERPYIFDPDTKEATLGKVPLNLANFTYMNVAWWDRTIRRIFDITEDETFKSFAQPKNGAILNVTKSEGRTFEVSKLDWTTLEFQALRTFRLPDHAFKEGRSWPEGVGQTIDEDHFPSDWIGMGAGTKLSAMTSAENHIDAEADPESWKRAFAWRDTDLRSTQAQKTQNLSIVFRNAALPAGEESVTVTFPSDLKLDSYLPIRKNLVGSQMGLLFVQGMEKPTPSNKDVGDLFGFRAFDRISGIWLFDRELFETIPVTIPDPPGTRGWWQTIENAKGQLLFEFRSWDSRFVELRILDVEQKLLRKVFRDEPPIEHRKDTRAPVIDYNKMKVVGWVLKNGLLLPMNKTIRRETE